MGFGAMRITGREFGARLPMSKAPSRLFRRAVELGVNFIDTADSYGPDVSEEFIAQALWPYPSGLVITTKAGWTRYGPGVWQHNAAPGHIQEALEGSLKRLRLERIDVYQLHVPDPATSFDASVETLARLREQGKIRHVGLSNVTLEHIKRAQKIVPIVCVQNRYSFSDREWDFVSMIAKPTGSHFCPGGPWRKGAKPTRRWRRSQPRATFPRPLFRWHGCFAARRSRCLFPGRATYGTLKRMSMPRLSDSPTRNSPSLPR